MTTETMNDTLRPGLLVSLKTSVVGNVKYIKSDLGADTADDGAERTKWETERTIFDRKEHEAGQKARSEASTAIRRVCIKSAFALLCPEADRPKLDAAIAEARAIADKFNATAKVSRLRIYVITGTVASDDVEAVKSINSEIADLMDLMNRGLEKMDVKVIRDAASRAKQIGGMLPADAAARVQLAVDTARAVASRMVKAGETAATEIDTAAINRITEMRTAFLDIGDVVPTDAPVMPGRAIDLNADNEAGGDAAEARAMAKRSRRKLEV